jgi:hypothetical protein
LSELLHCHHLHTTKGKHIRKNQTISRKNSQKPVLFSV